MLNPTIEDALKLLQELNAADPDMVRNFLGTRHRTNEAVAKHPTVQVALIGGKTPFIGVLGILNGLFSHDNKFLMMEPVYVCPFNSEHVLKEGEGQCPECKARVYLKDLSFKIGEVTHALPISEDLHADGGGEGS